MTNGRDIQAGNQFGNYILDRQVGEGGLGEVWLAHHAHLSFKPPVAIKFVLRPRPNEIARFQREAAILDKLRANPHIIRAEDYGVQDGVLYLVMQYAANGNLERRMRQSLSLRQVSDYLSQLADGLDFAHSNGILHRDLKPSNILVAEDGALLLADFGIAHEDNYELTGTGIGMGTAEYMPPEQFNDAKSVTKAADIYSLGILTFQMLTGRLPFTSRKEGNSFFELMNNHLSQPLPQVRQYNPNLPATIQPILERATAKVASQRYQTATEFAGAFQQAIMLDAASLDVPTTPLIAAEMKMAAPAYQLVAPPLTPVNPVAATPISDPPISQPVTVPTPKSNKGLLIGLGAGIAVLALAVIALILVLLANSSGTKPSTTVTIQAGNVDGVKATAISTKAVNNANPSSAGTPVATVNLPTLAQLDITPPPNFRKFDIPAAQLNAFLNQQTQDAPSAGTYKFEAYVGVENLTKLRAAYKADLEKKGWMDVTALYISLAGLKEGVAQFEALGGFFLFYKKGDLILVVVGSTSELAKVAGVTGIASDEALITFLIIKAP